MSDRSTDRPRPDPTRDIRLPPLSDRPAPAVPAEWSTYLPQPSAQPAAPAAEQAAPDPVRPVPPPQKVDEPTDRLSSPGDSPLRQPTRAFSPPAPSVQLLKVSVTPTRRRTTKVLWTLIGLTLLVIVACGIYLVVFVNQR